MRLIFIIFAFVSINIYGQINTVWTRKEAKRWFYDNSWNNGWNIKPHKSVDYLEFAIQYHMNKNIWSKLFSFLATTDIDSLAVGKYVIVPDKCWVNVSEYFSQEKSNDIFESHQNYIDLQYVLYGNEKMGIAKKVKLFKDYNTIKDVSFYIGLKKRFYSSNSNVFFLFFPNDIHNPSVRKGKKITKCKKIIAKIQYINH